MATMLAPHSRRRSQVMREAKLLYAIGFVYFLAAALVLRLTPRRWHSDVLPTSQPKSLIGEAKEATSSFVGFVYMH